MAKVTCPPSRTRSHNHGSDTGCFAERHHQSSRRDRGEVIRKAQKNSEHNFTLSLQATIHDAAGERSPNHCGGGNGSGERPPTTDEVRGRRRSLNADARKHRPIRYNEGGGARCTWPTDSMQAAGGPVGEDGKGNAQR